MKVRKFSQQEQAEVEQLIRSCYLSYPQIADRYGVSRFRIMKISTKVPTPSQTQVQRNQDSAESG